MRYKLTIEYDGTNLLGWQKQLDGNSVQGFLEQALVLLCPKTINRDSELDFEEEDGKEHTERSPGAYTTVREDASTEATDRFPSKSNYIHGAGRTDAGVHALGAVAHFDLHTKLELHQIRDGLNFHLRTLEAPVAILEVEPVADDFHARYSAKGRSYIYKIITRRAPLIIEKNRAWQIPVPLNIKKMQEAATYLLGNHDFSAFRAAACQADNPIRTLDKIEIIEIPNKNEIIFSVEARSFLHHQVRNIVGTLKIIGEGSLEPKAIKEILESKDRTKAGPTAPACGLYLNKIQY